MGTSLTEQHVGSIRRLARRAVLALDPDAAGLAAAERAGDLFLSLASPEAMARSARSVHTMTSGTDLELCVAGLPAGQDPDDLARSDPEAWKTATSQAPSFAAFAIDRLLKDEPLDSLGERRRLIDRVRPVLLAVRDPVERALYVQRVARQMGVREGAVQETLKVRGQPYSRPSKDPDPKRVPTEEETLLAILLQNDSLRPRMQSFPPDLFTESINREVFLRWLREVETDETETEDPVEGQKDWVNQLRIPPLNSAQAREAARTKVGAILRERLIQRQAAVGQEIAEAEKDLGAKEVASISHDAWMGAMPPDEVAPLAEAVIEELELGISIHRPDPPDL
jgi:DNA primase